MYHDEFDCLEDDGRYAFEMAQYEMEQFEMMLDGLGTTDEEIDRDEGFEEFCDGLEGRDDWMSQHEEMAESELDSMSFSELGDLIETTRAKALANLKALTAMMAVGIG